MKLHKALLIISFLIILTIIFLATYSYFQRETKQKEGQQIEELLLEINKVINLMDAIKGEMPKELSETHEYLINGG